MREVEEGLARLMPVAFSEEGQRSMDAMFDELFGAEEVAEIVPVRKKTPVRKIAAPVGIAAAAAMIIGLNFPQQAKLPVPLAAVENGQGMELMGESGRIEKMTDEGWVSDPQGGAMQAVRVQVVEENTLRDDETGIVVHVSEPREELLLFPVNAF
jgi:hypothetical protein